jgi:hypothetical protein
LAKLGKILKPRPAAATARAPYCHDRYACTDWARSSESARLRSRSDYAQAPTLDEARAFLAAYEAARGGSFERAERALCRAAFAYSVGYSSRCGHAFGKRERDVAGTFHHLLATHGEGLLRL